MEKYVLITGATGGLGKAFAVECARRGYNLYLTDLFREKLESLARGLASTYDIKTVSFPCDLMHMDARKEIFSDIALRGIEPWMAINVAGLDFEGPAEDQSRDALCKIIRINSEATLDISHYIARFPHKNKFFIINVASLAGFYPMPLKATYAATKRMVINFSLALREEIRQNNGSLTILCPAGMRTNEENINNIDTQGFLGRITTLETGTIASNTIDCVFRNKPIYIPGVFNHFLHFLSVIFPAKLIAKYIFYRWRITRKKLPLAREQ
ncbi:MAG: SDR family NAD(P)-dependent oxidoreductase [Bacillota bacterium]